jgi:hypothetical protein
VVRDILAKSGVTRYQASPYGELLLLLPVLLMLLKLLEKLWKCSQCGQRSITQSNTSDSMHQAA